MFCLTEDPVLPPVLHSLFDEFCFLTFLGVRKCKQPLSVFNRTSSHNQCSALGRAYPREKGAFVFCADSSGVQRQGGYAGFLCNADGLLNQLKTKKGIRINYDEGKNESLVMSQQWWSFLVSRTDLCSVQRSREGSGLQEQAVLVQGFAGPREQLHLKSWHPYWLSDRMESPFYCVWC